MGVLDVPPELLKAIACYCSVASASAFAQSSPCFFEEAADSRIYRDITITHAHQFAPRHNLVPISPPTTPSNRPITDPHRTTQSILRSLGSKPVFRAHLDALRARPWRASQVRKVDVQLGHIVPKELDELLALVAGGLRDLRVSRPSHVHLTASEDDTQLVGRDFDLPDRPFPALRRADLEIGPQWAQTLGLLLKRAPNLTALRVIGEVVQELSSNLSNTLSDTASQSDGSHTDLALQALGVGPISQPIVPLVANLIRRSPRLSWLRIDDPTRVWDPRIDDPLILVIAQQSTIRHLDVPSSCLRILGEAPAPNQLDRLDHLTVVWNFTDLDRKVDSPDSAVSEPLFPAMPTLKTCKFDLRNYDPGVPSYEVFRGRMFDQSVQAIRAHALRTSFASTPELQSIDLGSMYGLANVGPIASDYDSPPDPKDKWASFDGALITHYEDGDDHLVLVRHRSAFSCGWESYGVLNGSVVKVSCLAQVMDVDGKSLKRAEPGRGRLSAEGWEILRHWTARL